MEFSGKDYELVDHINFREALLHNGEIVMLFTQMSKEVTERIVISVTPKISKANGGVGKNSAGKANVKALSSPSNSDEKLLPHYLRASTGSCHDFCKYGRKHAFETKERHLIRPTFLGNDEITDEEHNEVKVIDLRERRKKQVPKLKTTSQTKAVESDKHKSSARKGFSPFNGAEGSCGKLVSAHLTTASPVNISLESAEHILPDCDEELSDESISIKEMIPSPNEGSIITGGNKSSSQAGGSSKEPISIKLMMPLPIGESYIPDGNTSSSQAPGVSEEPINLKLEIPSAMKENIDFTDSEPANLAEGSLEKQVKMNLHTPRNEKSFTSADDAPANGAEGSFKEPVMIKVMSLPSIKGIMASAEPTSSDGIEGSSEGPMEMELETPSIQCSSRNCEHLPATPAEGSSREHLCINVKTASSTEKPLASKKPASTKLRTPSHIQKKPAFLGHTVTQTQSEQDQSWCPNTGERKKKQAIKLKSTTPPKTKFSDKSEVLKQKEIGAFGKPDISLQKTVSPVKKLIRQKSLSSVKTIISSTKPIIIKKKTSSTPSGKDFTPGSSIYAKPKTSVVKTTSPLISSGGLAGQKKLQNKVSSSVGLSKNGEEKTLKPLRTSLSPKHSASRVSSTNLRKDRNAKPATLAKNQEGVRKEEESHENVKEKTLYVVSSKPAKKSSKSKQHKLKNNKTSLSSHSLQDKEALEDSSESTSTEGSEPIVGNGLKDKKQAEHSKYEDKKRLGRTASIQPQAEMLAPHKLKFRRGKVVNPQSENNGPRRLRFRQARVVSENQNGEGEAEKRSFRKRKDLGSAGSNESKLETPAVVLRHQDQQEKKDTQSLFNHVIEETASKLVETRKSKVKALVGAFETVISLQESKVAPMV